VAVLRVGALALTEYVEIADRRTRVESCRVIVRRGDALVADAELTRGMATALRRADESDEAFQRLLGRAGLARGAAAITDVTMRGVTLEVTADPPEQAGPEDVVKAVREAAELLSSQLFVDTARVSVETPTGPAVAEGRSGKAEVRSRPKAPAEGE